MRVREVLSGFEDSPERQDALRLVADRLDLPPRRRPDWPQRCGSPTGTVSAKVLEAGGRSGAGRFGGLHGASGGRAFARGALSRPFRQTSCTAVFKRCLSRPGEPAPELVPLLAELDARAAGEEIDEQTAKELLLRLRERHIRRHWPRIRRGPTSSRPLERGAALSRGP